MKLILLIILFFIFLSNFSNAAVINVPAQYVSIQAAVNAASDGDAIVVLSGTYNESQVIINKNLTVQGAGAGTTIIDGGGVLLAETGLVRIVANGNVVFDGFTIRNAGGLSKGTGDGKLNVGIYAQSDSTDARFVISNNKIYGTNDPNDDEDYGLYSHGGKENLVFLHNKITQTGANAILLERHYGPTNMSYNTFDRGVADGSSDSYFNMNYGGIDVTSLQVVSYNTIDMGTGTFFDNDHRGFGITFTSSFDGTVGTFTNVKIVENNLINLKSYRRGIGLWNNGAGDGGGGNFNSVVISDNIITGEPGSIGSMGIRLLGLATGTNITNNSVSDVEISFRGQAWNTHIAAETLLRINRFNASYLDWQGIVGLDAERNWWTSPIKSVVQTHISGTVDFEPYCLDEWCSLFSCEANTECGFCQKCFDGLCANESSLEDVKNECDSGVCKSGFCNGAGSCSFELTTTLCNSDFKCSNSVGADNSYGLEDFKAPRQGYCDEVGNCDYTTSGSVCTLGKNSAVEGTLFSMCWDGVSWCRDTCTDLVDNDNDGCFDQADVDCGGNETNCTNGFDDDCDGLIDEYDSDCHAIDTTSPTTIISSPPAGSYQYSTFYVSISDNDTGGSGLDYCQYGVYSFDGISWIVTKPWTIRPCNNLQQITAGLECVNNGNNTCRVFARAIDKAGNSGNYVTRDFSIDFLAPEILRVMPRNNSYTNDNTPHIFADFLDNGTGVNVSSVVMKVNGIVVPSISDGFRAEYIPIAPLADGLHQVEVSLKDIAGNNVAFDWFFTVDTIPPSISINNPLHGSVFDTKKIFVEVNITNEDVKNILISKNGRGSYLLCTECNSYSGFQIFNENDYNLTIIANDLAGNSAKASVSFLIDTLPPKIISNSPKNTTVVNGTEFKIRYTENNLESIELKYGENMENSVNCTGVSGKNVECSKTINLALYNKKIVLYEFILKDKNHIVSSGIYSIKVDKDAPIVNIFKPELYFYGTKKIPFFLIVNEMVYSISVSKDDGRFSGYCKNCDSVEKDLQFSEGLHKLDVLAVDYAGNAGYDEVEFFVDSVFPHIVLTIPKDKSYFNGTKFSVKYTEENLGSVELHYKNKSVLLDCEQGRNKECSADVDLVEFQGEWIEYYFTLNDSLHSVDSQKRMIFIDAIKPDVKINSPLGTQASNKILVNISSAERAKLGYSIDGGSYHLLCTSCTEKSSTVSVKSGSHTIKAFATDLAGNSDEKEQLFVI